LVGLDWYWVLSNMISTEVPGAGGRIYAGLFQKPFDTNDSHSKWGMYITIVDAALVIFAVCPFMENLFMGLIVLQILLSFQLPWTIFTQIMLTSSPKVMGKFANNRHEKISLWTLALVVTALNIMLLGSILCG
jgi:manganese transport protein